MKPGDVIISFSLALYSQWFFHKPTRCLFDAGEGVATMLGNKVFAIKHVFLSHGHEDHIAGISNMVNIRNLAYGEKEKPLVIHYPRHDRWVNALLEYIEKKQSGLLQYLLYAEPMDVGSEVDIEGTKRPTRVVAFEMQHVRGQLCLGYEIQQERSMIDPATGQHICCYHPIFFYTGDGSRAFHSPYGRLDMAVHEATFLGRDAHLAAEESNRHATVEMAVDWGAREDVKILILCHISDRYNVQEAIEAAVVAREKSGFRGDLYIAHCGDILPVPFANSPNL
ncbi:MAG: MBL fold metallo-hydrolase [Armatimonadota bacterium]|nr:MBL fold metallo-hydrolase [bacterium]